MRSFGSAFLATIVTLALLGASVVHAQEATPAPTDSALAASGLPELHIRITDTAYEVASAQVTAGLTLLVVENATAESYSATLGMPPAGLTVADVMATPPAGEEEIPAWIFEATITGGPIVDAGQTGYAVVTLTPGEWGVFGEGPQTPAVITVSGEAPAGAAEPAAAVAVQMQDFAFVGLPGTLPAGRQVWQVTTTGPQHHLLAIDAVPPGTTLEQVLALFEGFMTGTPGPGAGALTEADFVTVGGMEVQSAGQTAWVELDLAPGTYAVACFWPDPATGMPHAFMGMVAILTVA
jgi:hypothetical protein